MLASRVSTRNRLKEIQIMVIQMSRSYENASPVVLFEIVKDTTACSSTVFYGLLAWANLHAHNPSKAVRGRRHSA
jgi:hypothetical protein